MAASRQGRLERREFAVQRALELFDLTAGDHRWRGPKRREVLRAREAFCAAIDGDDVAQAEHDSLSRYFTHFARAARRAG